MRQHGLTPGSCNVYIRTVNAFLRWLHEEEAVPKRIKVTLLKEEQKVIKAFTKEQVQRFVHWHPKTAPDRRLHILMLLLLDTGTRISEVLTLKKENVDLNNLLITVQGKGNKQRTISCVQEQRSGVPCTYTGESSPPPTQLLRGTSARHCRQDGRVRCQDAFTRSHL